jgi:hypothetical protein
MHDDAKLPPNAPGRSAADSRREREAAALRANLRKRKEQQRARAIATPGEPPVMPEDPKDDRR